MLRISELNFYDIKSAATSRDAPLDAAIEECAKLKIPMSQALTLVFALLLALSSSIAAPVSRIDQGRDSSSIVWVARKRAEQISIREAPRVAARPSTYRGVAYCSRFADATPPFDLFQRPPPQHV
jgi:DNA-directed RNA polymerase subunit K/omega